MQLSTLRRLLLFGEPVAPGNAPGWTRIGVPHVAGTSELLVRAGTASWPTGGRVMVTTTTFTGTGC